MEGEEHVGPGSHSSLRSFWPGTSSGPCPSRMQPARTGAAARRPSTSGTANDHHVLTTLAVAPVAAPQREHCASSVEFVIFSPFPQIVPPLLQALLQDRLISRNRRRACPCSVGEGRRGGQDGHAHQRDRFCIRCAPRGYGRAFDAPLGNTPTASRVPLPCKRRRLIFAATTGQDCEKRGNARAREIHNRKLSNQRRRACAVRGAMPARAPPAGGSVEEVAAEPWTAALESGPRSSI